MPESIEDRFQTLHEIVRAARSKLDRNVWDYLVGGSETETTIARNRHALDSIAFRPRVLRDVSNIDSSAILLGKPLRMPVLMAPVGALQLFEPGGAGSVGEAARIFGNGMLVSSGTLPALEITAQKAGEALKIFQLYTRGDEAYIDEHFGRAIDSGYNALCLTVDTPYLSRRERDIAKRFGLVRRGGPGYGFQAQMSWRDVERWRAKFPLPFILKGIATVDDAMIALEHGIECIYVSNHGGRQLDHGLGSMEVLPEIVAAVNRRARIIVDGSISRGTDVVKAIALGADAVVVGRLYVYGLAAEGSAGIVRVMEILEEEIRICLGLLGATSFAELDRSYVCAAKPMVTPSVHSAFPLLDVPGY
ncbi:MAG TPA: alpha-hydroxy acid oxidase [Candidatus Binataceae bacterium]|jgi:isopentenyl diphosphate isomerase/L-lactate dehydrogenase-like FMN-dependent dehydrogenase|nr:alpha-hydroxy acid oxidase [Candidatus Binataceae bacterium]